MPESLPSHKIHCHYYGPITSPGKPSLGGYEAANRKNIDALRRYGVAVTEHPNPVKPKLPFGGLVYIKLFLNPFSMLRSAWNKNTVVHVTPLPRALWYPSLFCVWFAKRIGLKTVVDIRAGSFIRFYENRGGLYRRAVRAMLANADAVTVEGKAYIDYIHEITKGRVTANYFPNTIRVANERINADNDTEREFKILYFGRITSTKGIKVMTDAIGHLDKRFRLYLAGNIAEDIDRDSLLANDRITYLGNLNPTQLDEKKREMGFFIFPSRWSGEGQSNSLIEAMGAGLVPVASDNGFTRDVVGDAGFVLPVEASGKEYADTIARCVESGFAEMSQKAVNHIRQCHNLDQEIKKLTDIYNQILSAK